MAITEAPSSSPVAPAVASDQALRRPTPTPTPAIAKDDAPRQAVSADAAKAAAQPRPAPFALTQHYDQDTRRLILEARDPVSGFVIYQMPPKYVIKQFSASVSTSVAPARGARVDSAV